MSKTPAPIIWADHVTLRPRYRRSVHLERDSTESRWMRGYVVTPLVRSLTARVAAGLEGDDGARAWSITGPYGSGKSAFALFASKALGLPGEPGVVAARKLLGAADRPLRTRLFGARGAVGARSGLLPVLATGERRPLEHILVDALRDAAVGFWHGRKGARPSVIRALQRMSKRAAAGEALSSRDVVAAFEEVAAKVARSSHAGRGLLVVLDEAGKPLEYAAHSPREADIHVLQELAEAATRSGDTPIVFAVLLHQGFEHYVGRLGASERGEWSKVQGRFEDLPFHEADDQVLRLIGSALETASLPTAHEAAVGDLIARTVRLIHPLDGDRQQQTSTLLRGALPLHPLTALTVGPLFRSRLAQNERSLFAFLAATEPNGFQQYIREPAGDGTSPLLFTIDRLYDYVQSTLAGSLYKHRGRHWARVEAALRRLPPDATALDARVVKAVGILGAVGDVSEVPASAEAVTVALAEPERVSVADVEESLARLRTHSVLVFRKYRNAYQLWEGSDLDLDELVVSAGAEAESGTALLRRLEKVAPPRSIVARRHLLETGTLRYFEVKYADESVVGRLASEVPVGDADGIVWLAIPNGDRAAQSLRGELQMPLHWPNEQAKALPAVVAVPRDPERLRSLARELGAFERIQTNTPELRDDPIARRELEGRIADTTHLLREELQGLVAGRVACTWFDRGSCVPVRSARELASRLSSICDEVYRRAPYIHNELLNRRQLSSAGAAGRRALMTAMVEHGNEQRLGIEGFPAEYSMYRSALEHHGMHAIVGETWTLREPKRRKRGSLQPAWKLLQRRIAESEQTRLRLSDLYAELKAPPFGMKEGPLPVFVLVALLDGQREIALYEEGAFVPGITAPVLERMLRSPDRFELQRFRVVGAREEILKSLGASISKGSAPSDSILPVIRYLVRFVSRLPAYSRNTKHVSKTAQSVRGVLLGAREPGPLLFRDLPKACGFEPFDADGDRGRKTRAAEFDQALRKAVRELAAAYPALLENIERQLAEAFQVPNDADLRHELGTRARRLLGAAVEPRLKGFLIRAGDDKLAQEEWLVSIATLLGGKPPEAWYDQDLDQALLSLGAITRHFSGLEALLVHEDEDALEDRRLMRLSVAEAGATEVEGIATIRATDEAELRRFCDRLRATVQGSRAELPRDTLLAGLALVSRELIEDLAAARSQPGETRYE